MRHSVLVDKTKIAWDSGLAKPPSYLEIAVKICIEQSILSCIVEKSKWVGNKLWDNEI